MKKHEISIINCFLSVFVFLCVFGYTCYRLGRSNGNSDFGLEKAICFYFAIFIVIAICCICAKPYYSNKCFWVGAIFCMLYPVFEFCLWVYALIFNGHLYFYWIHWILVIFSPIISGLYVYAALVKD